MATMTTTSTSTERNYYILFTIVQSNLSIYDENIINYVIDILTSVGNYVGKNKNTATANLCFDKIKSIKGSQKYLFLRHIQKYIDTVVKQWSQITNPESHLTILYRIFLYMAHTLYELNMFLKPLLEDIKKENKQNPIRSKIDTFVEHILKFTHVINTNFPLIAKEMNIKDIDVTKDIDEHEYKTLIDFLISFSFNTREISLSLDKNVKIQ